MNIKRLFESIVGWARKYPAVIIGIGIFGYYLTTALDLFKKSGKMHLTPIDFVLHFDSLIWMWIAAFVFIKLQKTKEKFYGEEIERLMMQHQIEKSKIASTILNQITKQLQDTINNPLAIIGVMTEDIRKRFIAEPEVMRRLDQIDASLHRIHNAIKDVANYQAVQVLELLQTDIRNEILRARSEESEGRPILGEPAGWV